VIVVLTVLACHTAAAAGDIPESKKRSGSEFMGRELRAMQDEDAANPGMLAVLDGEALWRRAEGKTAKSCASCHGASEASIKGAAAHYPRSARALGRPVDLEQRINLCRTGRQEAPALPFDSPELLALTAYVARQSKGQPIAIADDPQTQPFIAGGREIFER